MATHEFEVLEQAAIGKLTPLLDSGTLAMLEPYTDQLDPQSIKVLVNQCPAIFVGADGLTADMQNQQERVVTSVLVAIVARELRGESGIYALLQEVQERLQWERPEAGWQPFARVRSYPMGHFPKLGVYVYAVLYQSRTANR